MRSHPLFLALAGVLFAAPAATYAQAAPPADDSVVGASTVAAPVSPASGASLNAPTPQMTGVAALQDAAVTFPTVVVTSLAPTAPLTVATDPRLPRQPVPASDGADYLKTIPGFTTLRNGGTNGDPVLRGMFGSRLNLIANGGALHGACPSRMDNTLSYVAPETYDRLTVVKGPQTVLWGPGASAGTVLFERDPEYFEVPGVRLLASALAGSHARNDQVLDVAAGKPLGYATLSANRSESGDYVDGDGRRVHSGWNKWNADAALGWTPDPDTVLELSAGIGDGEAAYAGRTMDGTRFRRDSVGLRFERGGFDGALQRVKANVYDNRVDHVMDNYTLRDPDPTSRMPMAMASNVGRNTQGARVALSWAWTSLELEAGLDHQRNEHRRRNAPGRGTYLLRPWLEDARLKNTGVFAEATLPLGERQRWVAGARIDRAEATDQRPDTGGMMPRPNPTTGMTRDETLSAGFVRYERELANVPLGWYAGIGRSERMPDYWELFSPTNGPFGSVNAFAGVQPETTTQLDFGLHYKRKQFEAWASAYVGRIDDYILFRYGTGTMAGMTRALNIDADIRGGEAGIGWRPAEGWKLDGSLAYAWGEQRENGRALPQMPPLEARLSASYEGRTWSAGALLRGVDDQSRVSVNEGNVVGRDIGPSKGFGVFSVNAAYRIGTRMRVSAGIDNVFDRSYAEHLNLAGNSAFGYPGDPVRISEPGRTAWLKLNVEY